MNRDGGWESACRVIGWKEGGRTELARKLIFPVQGRAGVAKSTPARPSMAVLLWTVTRTDG